MLSADMTQSKRQYKEDNGHKIYPIEGRAEETHRELQKKPKLTYEMIKIRV